MIIIIGISVIILLLLIIISIMACRAEHVLTLRVSRLSASSDFRHPVPNLTRVPILDVYIHINIYMIYIYIYIYTYM